jgi:glycolate oxidase FAD binding subunit
VPAGALTWLDCGNPVTRADVVLSTRRLTKIGEYSPPDLTMTCEAGLRLEEANQVARDHRQWLPIDAAGAARATLGGIVACDASGPLRMGYGTPRDYVIGLRLAHADGKASKCGGRVVKNVAGYDLNKLYVGSFGTLAIITELTFKLRPEPESEATIVLETMDRGALLDRAAKVMQSRDLAPASVFYVRDRGDSLAVRFLDSALVVKNQIDMMWNRIAGTAESRQLEDQASRQYWENVADLGSDGPNVTVRASVPRSEVIRAMGSCFEVVPGAALTADLGTGVLRVAFEEESDRAVDLVKTLRGIMSSFGGTVFVEKGPLDLKQRVDAWGDGGSAADLMRSLKHRFDPENLLNPGRFVSGI